MDLSPADFVRRYAEMSDEDLAELAINSELVPDAKRALGAELVRREITDLERYRALFARQREALVERARKRARGRLVLRLWVLLAVTVLLLAAAAWQWFVAGKHADAMNMLEVLAVVVPLYLLYLGVRYAIEKFLMSR